MFQMKFIITVLCFLLANSLKKNQIRSDNGHIVKITIAAANDVHGSVLSETKRYGSLKYDVGGFLYLETMLNSLRKENPNFIYLDAGDKYQGTLEKEDTEGSIVYEGFHELGLSATTIGNHEWDLKKDRLNKILTKAKYQYICANLKYLSDEEFSIMVEKYKQEGMDPKIISKIDKIKKTKFDHEKLMKSQIFIFQLDQLN